MRAIDPLVAIRELNQHPTFLWTRDVALACEGDAAATRSCVTAVIDVFGTHPIDATGDGLTDEETLAVLSEFMQYLDGLKKSTARSPSSSPSTAESPTSSTAAPMSSKSDCSSTAPVSDCGAPTTSPKASVSP